MIDFSPTLRPARPGYPQLRGVLHPTGDGGYAFVATARTTAIDDPLGKYPGVLEPAQDFLAMAMIASDGTVDLRRTFLPIMDEGEPPDESRLKAIAMKFGSNRMWPGQPASWTSVRLTDELTDFIERGLVGSRRSPFTLAAPLARRLRKVVSDLRLAEGSLYQRLSRHHSDIPDYMARLSGALAFAKPMVDARPWIPTSWLATWDKYDNTRGVTADDFAFLVDKYVIDSGMEPSISAAGIRWCDRFFAKHPASAPRIAFIELLSMLPMSWWPTELDDYTALNTIADTLLHLCDRNPETTLDMLRPTKGRFASYVNKIGRENLKEGEYYPPNVPRNYSTVDKAISDCIDLVRDVHESLVSPFTGSEADEGWQTALEVVSKGGGLRRYLDASRAWHDIPRQEGRLTTKQHVWTPCVEPFTYGDLVLVELCSAIDLWDEGVAMEHCVGGDHYVRSCMHGMSRILSVRHNDRPVSTVEIDRAFKVIQHRGHDNLEPSPGAKEAVDAWGKAIRNLDLPTRPMLPVAIPEVAPVTTPGYGPAAWRRFIRRDLANMSWEEFGDTVCAIEAETAPADDPSGMSP